MSGDLPPAWREYRIIQITGWTFDEIDAANGQRVDELLAVHGVVLDVRAEAEEANG